MHSEMKTHDLSRGFAISRPTTRTPRHICLVIAAGFVSACGSSPPRRATAIEVTQTSQPRSAMASSEGRAEGRAEGADPFDYLAKAGDDAASWEKEQTRKTVESLHHAKGFDGLFRKAQAYRAAKQPPKQMDIRGALTFAIENGDGDASVVVRRASGEKPVVLFRTDGGDSHRVSIDFIAASPSGKWLAVGTSEGGSEETQVRLLDARTGKDLGDRSEDVRLQQLVWFPDERGYLYMRGRGRKGVPVADQNKELNIALHTVGKGAQDDVEIVGPRAPGKRVHAELEYCYPSISPDGKDVVVAVRHGLNPEMRLFAKRRDKILDGNEDWKEIYGEKSHVTAYSVGNGRLVAVRLADTEGAIVEQLELGRPSAPVVLYRSALPVNEVVTVGAGTYVVETKNATKLLVFLTSKGAGTPVALPDGRSVVTESIRVDLKANRLIVQLRSWTELPSWWVVSSDKDVKPVPDVNAFGAVQNDFQVRTTEVAARDGELIPVTIVGPKGDTKAPRYVLASAYGSYGFVLGPSFTPTRRIFLDLGGTFVFIHIRGGGEKGKSWHDGGIMLSGGSAGGIPVGGLLDREPDLVQAVAIESGVTNVSELEGASSIGALHKEEFGSKDTPEDARRLRSIDAYLNIRDGVKYPATVLFAGSNDVRVPKWQSSKFVARLQRAQAGDQPVLLRMTGGGHVSGNTRDEDSAINAEWLVLGLSRIGHPDFQ
jgi:prolyl oligopeptidase